MFGDLATRRNDPIPRETGYLVFLYGTLMEGMHNHWLVEKLLETRHAVCISKEARAVSMVIADIRGLPAMYPGMGALRKTTAHGELYCVSPDGLMLLDAFEGTPHFYTRKRLAVAYNGSQTATTEYYAGPRPGMGDHDEGYAPVGHACVKASGRTFSSNWKEYDPTARGPAVYYRGGYIQNEPWPRQRQRRIGGDIIFNEAVDFEEAEG